MSTSGTPTAWLASLPGGVLEVHCVCSASIAAARFTARQRHAGHLDALRDVESTREEIERLSVFGPLGVGKVLQVHTSADVELDHLVESIRRHG